MIFWLLCFQLCFSKVNHVFVERIECFFSPFSIQKVFKCPNNLWRSLLLYSAVYVVGANIQTHFYLVVVCSRWHRTATACQRCTEHRVCHFIQLSPCLTACERDEVVRRTSSAYCTTSLGTVGFARELLSHPSQPFLPESTVSHD